MRHAMAGVRASGGAVLVRDGEGWSVAAQSGPGAVAWRPEAADAGLRRDKRDPDWPVRLALPAGGGAVAGWMLLGPRPDGTLPGKEEREALEIIAEPVGRAIRVAQRREAEKAESAGRFERLEAEKAESARRFERLEASVRALTRRLRPTG